jgi:hypothetical protein
LSDLWILNITHSISSPVILVSVAPQVARDRLFLLEEIPSTKALLGLNGTTLA